MTQHAKDAVHGTRFTLAHAALALIGLGWSLPFLWPYRPVPLGAFYSESMAIASGLAAATLLLAPHPREGFHIPAAAIGLVLLAGLVLLQAVAGRVTYPGDAYTAARYLAWAALLVVLGKRLGQDLGTGAIAGALAWFLFGGGIASALIALIQLYRWDTPLNAFIALANSESAYGNLGQPAQFAGYVALGVASTGYLYARRALAGAVAWPAMTVFLFVVALSGRRAVWLYFVVFALLALWQHRRAPGEEGARLRAFTLALLPGFLLAQWAVKLPFLQIPEEVVVFGDRLFEVASGVGPRLWLARVAWDMFAANPLFGAGVGQFALHNFLASADLGGHPLIGLTRHAHNIVLQLLAETGIGGAGILIGFAAVWMLDLRRAAFDAPLWWLLALLGVIGVYSMLEYPLWYAYFLGIAAFLVGVAATRTFKMDARAGFVLTAATIALGAYLLVTSVLRYRGFEHALYSSRTLPPAQRDAVISGQLERNRNDPHLAPYVELIVSRSMDVSERQVEEKLQLNARVMRFAPVSHVVYRHAALLALGGDRAGAERQLRRAANVYPAALPQAIKDLREGALRYPDKLEPLLKLALAAEASRRAPSQAR